MTIIKEKKIIIDSSGPIYPKGGIYGPILTPYKENIETIAALIQQRYNVYEVLDNGKRIKLDLRNINKDNNAVNEQPKREEKSNPPQVKQHNNQKKNKDKQAPKEEVVSPSNNKIEDDIVAK